MIPERNRFRFRLSGYDERWTEVDAFDRNAFYFKVLSGDYVSEVYAANNDGMWGDISVRIKIRRMPAPWYSWKACILYAVALLLMIYLIVREYNNKLRLQIYMDKIEKDKKEEIHKSQLTFFTNISHDFKTPLSLILPALTRMGQEGLQEYYYQLLSNNARRLLNLVNELMDFRTVENGKIDLSLQSVHLNY